MTISEHYKKLDEYIEHMFDENIRVSLFLDDCGATYCNHVDFNYCNRYIGIENIASNGFEIRHTYFAIPESMNLIKVVKWVLNNSDFSEVTVYRNDRNPVTMRKHDKDFEFEYYLGE